jgi:nicotinamidase-related amidase
MTKALIVIDVQESFRARPLWRALNNPDLIDNVHRLVEGARGAGDRVIWVLHEEPGSGGDFDPANGLVRIMDELKPAADEPIVRKTSHNAFTTTNLQQLLTEARITELAICGIRTE